MDTTDLKFNIRFLRCVKKYPVIYNTKLKDYKTRNCIDCRDTAWRAIAEELNCHPLALKKKWKNFRTIASRKLRQEQMGQNVPPYYLHDHIKFLIPFLRTTSGLESSNKQFKNGESEEKKEDEYDGDNQYESNLEQDVNVKEDQDPIYFDYDEDDFTASDRSKSLPVPEEKVHVSKPYVQNRRSSNIQNGHNTTTSSHVTSTSTVNAERDQLAAIEKAKKQFLDSLLPDLNQMSHSQMRQFKYKVLELIDNILIEN